jgi:hypothetical protein
LPSFQSVLAAHLRIDPRISQVQIRRSSFRR